MLDLVVLIALKLMYYVVVALHLKALEHFTFSDFFASVVYAKL